MSLRERLGIRIGDSAASRNKPRRQLFFERFGFLDNPFPPASQPRGHQHMPTDADKIIESRLQVFVRQNTTQALVVVGTQGTGKTNLLEYYQRELSDIFSEDTSNYIVRYYPDPEPDFSSVVRRIMQEFGSEFLKRIGEALAKKEEEEAKFLLRKIHNPELRLAFKNLASSNIDERDTLAELLLEHLTGLRVFKRHAEALGIHFRLETTEAKTNALRDLIVLSGELGVFNALYLFLDELEKQGTQPQPVIVKYLSSIRALIDALPNKMFLLIAMSTDARSRYSEMFPALSSRLAEPITLAPVSGVLEANSLIDFYLRIAKKETIDSEEIKNWTQGSEELIVRNEVSEIYELLKNKSEKMGIRGGVTQRQLLNAVFERVEVRFLRSDRRDEAVLLGSVGL